MRTQDVRCGETYRFKDHPTVGYAKVLGILKPKEGVNTNTYSVVKCEHTYTENGAMCFIRYFKPSSLIKL